jgi:Mg2+-importing ATPase
VWRPAPTLDSPAKAWSGSARLDDSLVSTPDEIDPEEIWQEPVDRLLKRLATDPSGLDTAQAQSRFAVYGDNTAAIVKRSPLWLQFLARFLNPLVLILLAASGLSAVAGDAASFFIVAAIVLISITLDFVQEVRAENAVEALRRSVAVQTTVRRDGASRSVPIDRLVPGDIVELIAGDLIPATRGYSKAAICSSISRS